MPRAARRCARVDRGPAQPDRRRKQRTRRIRRETAGSAHEEGTQGRSEAARDDGYRTAQIPDQDEEAQIRGRVFRGPFPQQTRAKGARTPFETCQEDSGCAGLAQRLHCGPTDGGRGRAARATTRPARPRLCVRHYRGPRG